MIRIPVPSFRRALWLGTYWRNIIIVACCGGLLVIFLSPALALSGFRLPWIPDEVNLWWLIFGMLFALPVGQWIVPHVTQAWIDFRTAIAISHARRVFYQLKPTSSGKIVAEFRVVFKDGQEQTVEYRGNLAGSMPEQIYRQAREMFAQQKDLPASAAQKITTFFRQSRRIVELLERQNRDALLLEADEAMIDKMEQDYLFLISRYYQMQSTVSLTENLEKDVQELKSSMLRPATAATRAKEQDRMTILSALLDQTAHRDRLRQEVSNEANSLEERLAFIHDSLSLHGHPEVITERIYLPSPLIAELQSLSWENL